MKKCILVMGLLVLLMRGSVLAELTWEDCSGGNTDIKTFLADPVSRERFYIGSGKGVFLSEDGGDSWRNILSISGQNRVVNLLQFGLDKNSLYAATGNGFFYSSNCGQNWKRIFKGKSYFEADILSFMVTPGYIYLGTAGGLFISRDQGRIWRKQPGKLGQNSIANIAADKNNIYVVSSDGVFRSNNKGEAWERVFFAHRNDDSEADSDQVEDSDEIKQGSNLKYIAVAPGGAIYLATSEGAYMSKDKADSWEKLPDYGLLSCDIKFLLAPKDSLLYAVAGSGVFEYKDQRWHELSFGLSASRINALGFDSKEKLYAACYEGLFAAKKEYINNETDNNALSSNDAPTIREVQQAAIKYAEVDPNKIKRWRKQAASKAWLPEVTASVDRDTSDLWHWESGSTAKADDDTLRKGNSSIGWDVSVSWDLGDVIFNDDQTSIDVRSRLMVQLRDDILDEVNKLYFERLRVRMELNNLAIEDGKKRAEKELRLQELAASLDALTGGYFSQRMNKKI
ncbi:MAG: hypothetical protein V1650_00255 [Candidatus Omnitrophota bacterium]